jgi:hypothetical protein
VSHGEKRNARLAHERAHLAPRHVAVGSHVVDAGNIVVRRVHERADDVGLVHELHARVEAEDLGYDRPAQREREGRIEIVAEHVREPQAA